MTKQRLNELVVGQCFSFNPKGPVHMLTRFGTIHAEYKSYSDGKIRVYVDPKDPGMNREVYVRHEWVELYSTKWFRSTND